MAGTKLGTNRRVQRGTLEKLQGSEAAARVLQRRVKDAAASIGKISIEEKDFRTLTVGSKSRRESAPYENAFGEAEALLARLNAEGEAGTTVGVVSPLRNRMLGSYVGTLASLVPHNEDFVAARRAVKMSSDKKSWISGIAINLSTVRSNGTFKDAAIHHIPFLESTLDSREAGGVHTVEVPPVIVRVGMEEVDAHRYDELAPIGEQVDLLYLAKGLVLPTPPSQDEISHHELAFA